jgi:hypothetical protein
MGQLALWMPSVVVYENPNTSNISLKIGTTHGKCRNDIFEEWKNIIVLSWYVYFGRNGGEIVVYDIIVIPTAFHIYVFTSIFLLCRGYDIYVWFFFYFNIIFQAIFRQPLILGLSPNIYICIHNTLKSKWLDY